MLDRPLQMRILGGTPDPYGVVIDWRFNAAPQTARGAESACPPSHRPVRMPHQATRVTLESAGARRASTLLAAAMAFSKTTGIDPVAHGLVRRAALSSTRP